MVIIDYIRAVVAVTSIPDLQIVNETPLRSLCGMLLLPEVILSLRGTQLVLLGIISNHLVMLCLPVVRSLREAQDHHLVLAEVLVRLRGLQVPSEEVVVRPGEAMGLEEDTHKDLINEQV